MNSLEFILPTLSKEELSKIKKEKLALVLLDEDIKEMMAYYNLDEKFISDNIYYFYEFMKDKELCKECRDASNCKKKGCHLSISLKIDKYKKVSFAFSKCRYQIEIDQLKKKYLYKQFDDEIFNYKLSSCLNYYAVERAPIIKNMIEYRKTPNSKGMYIFGSPETGKSFILSVFSVYLAKSTDTKEISYIDCSSFIKTLENNFKEDINYFDFVIDELKKSQYLFLDDLGKEYKNEFSLFNVLLPILEYRKENNLATFISSSYSINELKMAYSKVSNGYKGALLLEKNLNESMLPLKLSGLKYSVLR